MKIRKQIVLDERILKETEKFIEETNGEIIDFTQLVRHSLIFYMTYKRKYRNDIDNIKFLEIKKDL
jgi:hypothetical protein